MTKDEFIDWHCAQKGITRDELLRVAVPCGCGDEQCPGWIMIPGPSMLVGPRWTVPNGLTPDQLIQFMDDCAADSPVSDARQGQT